MTTAAPATEFIVQRQEDHPGNPGWWRYSRPEFHCGAPPPFSNHERVWYGNSADARRAQAEWDSQHPQG